ncbi:MAG: undecaprenyl/decaprenyl-phosphate alpha-N-acetylglucosaminyl 1-phosphate transferase [Planctomycetaceae bacterium]|jgi:UDP-GlcNAc:undecaprenyl-phosphate GlcNAc-1-phosphate transferase|nr:undecaprenyl/decaprenyl-phosphate alpha-N-acetylglucosaminyl 1-phosphate transferase [Planctomycetaceae bacterium]
MFSVLLIACFAAFLFSVFLCRQIRYFAPYWGLVDHPGERKIHTKPIPTGGGLGIGLSVLLTFALCQLCLILIMHTEMLQSLFPALFPTVFQTVFPEVVLVHLNGVVYRSRPLWILLGLGGVLLLLGTIDDRYNLSWIFRFGVQIVVAIIVVSCGWRLTVFINAPILTNVLSVIWIVGLVNSFNMLDNMNGLSAGIATICSVFLAVVMFITPNPLSLQPQFFVAGFLFVLVGALAGFLMYNNPFHASLFMGNGGAYFIGFLLATSTLTATFSGYDGMAHTVYVPLLILAVPVYDMTTVILIRIRNKKSPFVGDKNHFSHRLVDLGFSKTQAVLTVYLTTTICCLGSLLLYQVNFLGASLIFLQTLLLLFLIGIIEYVGRK